MLPGELRNDLNADIIVSLVEDGDAGGLTGAARVVGCAVSAIYQWMSADAAFMARMEAARAIGAENIAERTRLVARGVEGHSSGDVKRDRLIIEQDNNLLAKWHPKRYGAKLEVEQTNRNATLDIPADMSAEEAARRYQDFVRGS